MEELVLVLMFAIVLLDGRAMTAKEVNVYVLLRPIEFQCIHIIYVNISSNSFKVVINVENNLMNNNQFKIELC